MATKEQRELEAERDALLARIANFDAERSEILMNAQTLTQEQIRAIETATIERCAQAVEARKSKSNVPTLIQMIADDIRALKPKEST